MSLKNLTHSRIADNITNKLALKNSGGAQGFPMTIASLQLGVGVVYALFAWAAPDMRSAPSITFEDVKAMVSVCVEINQ